jgi:hypothetical protein
MRILLIITLSYPLSLSSQPIVNILLANNSKPEQEAKAQLERLVRAFDLKNFIYTADIVIDEKTFIPHSHPKLTINARYLNDDNKQLATFLHEQFHWLEELNADKFDLTIKALRQQFPQVPVGNRAGARDEYSTYLHLIICDLEFQAMTLLIGEQEARKTLEAWQHYTWIYDKVLHDPFIRSVNSGYGLTLTGID